LGKLPFPTWLTLLTSDTIIPKPVGEVGEGEGDHLEEREFTIEIIWRRRRRRRREEEERGWGGGGGRSRGTGVGRRGNLMVGHGRRVVR